MPTETPEKTVFPSLSFLADLAKSAAKDNMDHRIKASPRLSLSSAAVREMIDQDQAPFGTGWPWFGQSTRQSQAAERDYQAAEARAILESAAAASQPPRAEEPSTHQADFDWFVAVRILYSAAMASGRPDEIRAYVDAAFGAQAPKVIGRLKALAASLPGLLGE